MRIGIDLGGTKIEAVALDDAGVILERRRIETPKDDYGAVIDRISQLIWDFENKLIQKATVGVGIPGALSLVTGLVKNANSTCLIGRPLDQDLAARLQRPIRLSNDANCFALSEAHDGAACGAKSLFGVILGTGVGGGLVIEGRILQGHNAIAGEWGHNPLPWPGDDERPGPPCYCGRRGCIEAFLSGPALARQWRALLPHSADDIDAATVGQAAAEGDSKAETLLQLYEDRLARALALVINIVDPEVIVLGGGLSNLERLYRNIPGRLSPYVFSDEVATAIRPPVHGDSSGVRGAAWLWTLAEAADPANYGGA